MAVASLAHGTDLAHDSAFDTSNVTVSVNSLVLLACINANTVPNGLVPDPVLGLSWVQLFDSLAVSGTRTLSLWRGMSATGGTGPVHITKGVATDEVGYEVIEVTGVDTSGSNGSGAVVQTGSASNTTSSPINAALGVASSTSSWIIGIAGDNIGDTNVHGAGYTTLTDFSFGSGFAMGYFSQWITGVAQTSCEVSFSGGANHGMMSLEVKANLPPDAPSVSAWGMQPPQINRERPSMIASGSAPGTRIV